MSNQINLLDHEGYTYITRVEPTSGGFRDLTGAPFTLRFGDLLTPTGEVDRLAVHRPIPDPQPENEAAADATGPESTGEATTESTADPAPVLATSEA